MKEYDGVIREQIERGIVEVVDDQTRLKRPATLYITSHITLLSERTNQPQDCE